MQDNRTPNEDAPRRGAHFKENQPFLPTHVDDSSTGAVENTPASTYDDEARVGIPHVDDPSADGEGFWNPADEFRRQEQAELLDSLSADVAETPMPEPKPHDFDSYDEADVSAALPKRRRKKHKDEASTDIQRYFDVNRYRRSSLHRSRMTKAKFMVGAVVALIMAIGVAVALYVADIDERLTHDITAGLRDQLEHSEPGDPFYLLLLGIDKDQGRVADVENYGSNNHAYRSDSIMLCRIDPKNVKVTMVSIHRDTLINMDHHGQQKINAAYAFGGAEYATEVVSEFAGVPISHYAEVDLDRFIAIVDVVGGIDVDLPVPVYDPNYTGLNLPAGKQKLNGLEAALLCRCRHGYDDYGDGDLFRAANQRMVFSQIIKTVMRSDPGTIIATITQMADSVTTDLTLAAILDLAGQMQTINVDTDIMTGMEPTEGVQIGDGWYEVCVTSAWNKMMNRVNKGLPPYEEGMYDSTAGIAGGVGEAGAAAAAAAAANGHTEPSASTTKSNAADTEDGAIAQDNTNEYVPEPEPIYVPEPEPEYIPEEEPVYYEEPIYYEEPVYYEEY